MCLSLTLSRMTGINMSITVMLYMHLVFVGPKSVKGLCLSKLSIVRWVLQYTCDNTSVFIKSVGPQPFVI